MKINDPPDNQESFWSVAPTWALEKGHFDSFISLFPDSNAVCVAAVWVTHFFFGSRRPRNRQADGYTQDNGFHEERDVKHQSDCQVLHPRQRSTIRSGRKGGSEGTGQGARREKEPKGVHGHCETPMIPHCSSDIFYLFTISTNCLGVEVLNGVGDSMLTVWILGRV